MGDAGGGGGYHDHVRRGREESAGGSGKIDWQNGKLGSGDGDGDGDGDGGREHAHSPPPQPHPHAHAQSQSQQHQSHQSHQSHHMSVGAARPTEKLAWHPLETFRRWQIPSFVSLSPSLPLPHSSPFLAPTGDLSQVAHPPFPPRLFVPSHTSDRPTYPPHVPPLTALPHLSPAPGYSVSKVFGKSSIGNATVRCEAPHSPLSLLFSSLLALFLAHVLPLSYLSALFLRVPFVPAT